MTEEITERSEQVAIEDALGVAVSVVPTLLVGEAVSVDADAHIRNPSCTVTRLRPSEQDRCDPLYDVEDGRVGQEGDLALAADVITGVIGEVQENAPDVTHVKVTRYIDPDVDPETGWWRDE